MDNIKSKFKKAIDKILDKKPEEAKTIIREAIQSNARYISYKKELKKLGFNFQSIDVPDETYHKIDEALKEFPKKVKLKLLDEMYFRISKNENMQ